MEEQELPKRREKRTRVDFRLRVISCCGIIGWIIVVIAMMIAERAKPEMRTVATRFEHVYSRTAWIPELTRYLFYLMIVGFAVSTLGLLISMTRMNRKRDLVRINLVLLWIISGTGIIYFLFFQ
jgi:hypothetical protein